LGQLTGHILTHFRTVKGVPDKQVNIQVLQMNIGNFVDDLASLLKNTIPDTLSHITGSELRRKVGAALVQTVEERFKEVLPIEDATFTEDEASGT
jgi:hypothetical protein